MRVALLGATGQLGTDLQRSLAGHALRSFNHSDFDVCDAGAARRALLDARPEVIVNTTAFVRVDECETRAEHAFAVNALAARGLALIAAELGARFVHFSTDYVYGGRNVRPLTEDVPPAPMQVYGASKAAGEWLVFNASPQALVIRSSGLYGVAGSSGKGGNFVQTVLKQARAQGRLKMVADQHTVPTFTEDLAAGAAQLIEGGTTGIVHLVNGGSCTWYEFARCIVEVAGIDAEVTPQATADYPLPAARPAWSVLESSRLAALGVTPLRPWREAVTAYLAGAKEAE